MEPIQQLGRLLLSVGAMLIVIGAFFYFGPKLPFRLGRLPGDIVHRGEHGTFYFPLVSCLVISIFVSLILDRKSTRLNSSHLVISYAVFCLKKKKQRLKRINDR